MKEVKWIEAWWLCLLPGQTRTKRHCRQTALKTCTQTLFSHLDNHYQNDSHLLNMQRNLTVNIIDVNTGPIWNTPNSNARTVELCKGKAGTKCTHYRKPVIPLTTFKGCTCQASDGIPTEYQQDWHCSTRGILSKNRRAGTFLMNVLGRCWVAVIIIHRKVVPDLTSAPWGMWLHHSTSVHLLDSTSSIVKVHFYLEPSPPECLQTGTCTPCNTAVYNAHLR